MNSFDLGNALRSGKKVYGTAVVSPSPRWPKMIAGTGLDFVFIDIEHIPIDREKLSWMCLAYDLVGLAPIVRIPEPNPDLATAVLDGGACGIIAPYLETVEQIRKLRGAVKLRPLKGKRLARALAGEETLEPELASYIENRNKSNLLIPNLESVPALEIIDELLAVPQIDAVLVGPHDLTSSLAVPEQYDHPKFETAIEQIITACRSRNIGIGIHYSGGIEKEIAWAKKGANMLMHSSDMSLVEMTIKQDLKRFQDELGED